MSEKTVLNVEGMTCSNCAQGISRFLEKKGLKSVIVDFPTGEVAFEKFAPGSMNDIVKGIQGLGYRVLNSGEPTGHNGHAHNHRSRFTLELKFIISALFTLPLLLHMVFDASLLHSPLVQWILCTPVFLIGLQHFGKSAWSSLKTGIPNMDVLITLGAASAYFYSVAGILLNGDHNIANYLFFETSATIITLVLLGNIIEKNSVRKTTSALKDLAALQPPVANKITIGNNLEEIFTTVPVSELQKHDPVLVNTGGVIPVDGKIYWGAGVIDESSMTGESIPTDKLTGDDVIAGTIVVSGTIKITTGKAGSQTVLSNIIELVKQAQHAKPPIQKLGDKISAWFVPAVILIAIVTFLLSFFVFHLSAPTSMMHAIAVLVISCPCAMGLATPTAVAVGLGKAARQGIIVKGGDTLELFENIRIAVFDKTGTLTIGKFRISTFKTYDFSEQEATDIIYSLEHFSDHSLANSLVTELKSKATKRIGFENVSELKGSGIKAEDSEGNKYLLGSYNSHRDLTTDNTHTVYLSKNNKLIATVDLRDDIKPGAEEMIRSLKANRIETVLLSGDTEKRCREVATKLGIPTVFSGQLPHDKTRIIYELKQKGNLLMVGDGINDAPSLSAADLGMSFGHATKIAVNSARVILLNSNDMKAVITALRTGKLTLQTIRQNLFWAFLYNVIAIPVAAMGFLSPMVAALSMAFSDVVVIGNSLRLKFRK